MTTTTQVSLSDLTPYQQIPKEFPDLFPAEKWKWKVAQRKHNGLSRAFCKVGRDLYVNKIILAECIAEQSAD